MREQERERGKEIERERERDERKDAETPKNAPTMRKKGGKQKL